MTFPFALLVVGGAALIVVGALALRRPARGSRSVDAPATTSSNQLLADAASRTRRYRILGAVGVSAVAALTDVSGPVNLVTIAGGFATGSLLAELTRQVRQTGTRRKASLTVRGITDHVSPFVPAALVGSMGLLAVVTVAATTLPGPGWNGELPPDRWFVITALVSSVGGVTALALARRIARQPVDVSDPARAAAHHAIRTSASWSVLGGGLICVGVGLIRVAGTAALHDSDAHVLVRHLNNVAFWSVGITLVIAGVWSSFEALPRRRRTRSNTTIAAVTS